MQPGNRSIRTKVSRVALPFLMGLVVLAGCAGEDEQAAPVTVLDQKQVDKALLEADDLPDGFTQSPPIQGSSAIATPTGCAELDAIGLTSTATNATAKGEVQFKKSEFGPFIQQSISVQPGQAKELFDRAAKALQVCPSFMTTQGDGTPTEVRLTPLAFPPLGDDTFAARLSFQTSFSPLSVDLAVVRLGDTFVTNAYFALGSGDPRVLEQAATKAVEKVRSAA